MKYHMPMRNLRQPAVNKNTCSTQDSSQVTEKAEMAHACK